MSHHSHEHPEDYGYEEDYPASLAEHAGLSDHRLARTFDFPPAGTVTPRPYYLARGRVFTEENR